MPKRVHVRPQDLWWQMAGRFTKEHLRFRFNCNKWPALSSIWSRIQVLQELPAHSTIQSSACYHFPNSAKSGFSSDSLWRSSQSIDVPKHYSEMSVRHAHTNVWMSTTSKSLVSVCGRLIRQILLPSQILLIPKFLMMDYLSPFKNNNISCHQDQ